MAKKILVEAQLEDDVVSIPVALAKLITSMPEDFKTIEQYEQIQVVAKAMLRLLAEKNIVWGT